jgi:threonylcarbamoyladenosine tRNA methylthiotransferase CDKAL1
MKRLNTQVVKSRSREATSFFESYTSYEKLLNTNQRVLVTEISADGKNYVGHNKFYHQVLVPKDPRLMGQSFDVRIVSVHKWHVMGEVIESSLCLDPLVLPKRAPKLVRKQRKVHTIENGSSEGRKDGAYLSSGKRSFSTHQLYISIFIALALIIWKLEFRWSLRILIIVLLLGILFRMRNE